jgi:hypothetical protein
MGGGVCGGAVGEGGGDGVGLSGGHGVSLAGGRWMAQDERDGEGCGGASAVIHPFGGLRTDLGYLRTSEGRQAWGRSKRGAQQASAPTG